MTGIKKHILLVEPYFGGSHKAFLEGLQAHVHLDFTVLSLPARKWKMRMQVAAPWMAQQIDELYRQGSRFDGILCSTFIDVAVLRSMLAGQGLHIPLAVYFHENQFAYPGQVQDPASHQFTNINWTTALVADTLFFNSRFNLESFLSGITFLLKKAVDVDLQSTLELIKKKSVVLYPGIDFSALDRAERKAGQPTQPVIVWNHRWEHDKDPETFFEAVFGLQQQGVDFKLVILGQHFRNQPEIFAQAQKKLADHILHFGYAESLDEYAALLQQGDVVVSTARHEFFGIAILEAVRSGCRPLVPDRLSYRELYPGEYRYSQAQFSDALKKVLKKQSSGQRENYKNLARRFSWPRVARLYEDHLLKYCSINEAVGKGRCRLYSSGQYRGSSIG